MFTTNEQGQAVWPGETAMQGIQAAKQAGITAFWFAHPYQNDGKAQCWYCDGRYWQDDPYQWQPGKPRKVGKK
jgi:hypothetical protein